MMMKKNSGFTFVEVIFAMALLIFISMGVMQGFKTISGQTVRGNDRSFAAQKVAQMMEELRGVIELGTGSISDYDDSKFSQPKHIYVLTTDMATALRDNPSDPLSGNPKWRYSKSVQVETVANEPSMRKITVRVFLHSKRGANPSNPQEGVLAQAVTFMRTAVKQGTGWTQYHLFVMDILNSPHWNGSSSVTGSAYSTALARLYAANRALKFSNIGVNQLSYGRSSYYRPYLNSSERSDNISIGNGRVYFYPGWVGSANTGANSLYEGQQGPIWYDSTYSYGTSGWSAPWMTRGNWWYRNQYGASMPDQYNASVRAPEEWMIYWHRTNGERTLRLMIDGMNGDIPEGPLYHNSVFFNLNGDVLPMPPLRNYADPAKDPGYIIYESTTPEYYATVLATQPPVYRYVRAAAHPQFLETPAGRSLRIRVYAFISSATAGIDAFTDHNPSNAFVGKVDTMTVTIRYPTSIARITMENLLRAAGNIRVLDGNSSVPYAWRNAVENVDYKLSSGPDINAFDGSDVVSWGFSNTRSTVITLYKTQLGCKVNTVTDQGLPANRRLYGLEYIPCVVRGTSFDDAAPNDDSLTRTGDFPKNTARWTIRVPQTQPLPAGMYTIETRIGDDITTGNNKYGVYETGGGEAVRPENISRTYSWVNRSAPFSEKSQFMGDPRYTPYQDVKADHRYNWYFGPPAGSMDGYTGFDRAAEGAAGMWDGRVNFDVPRYFELIRTALMRSNSVIVNVSGRAFSYISVGGEIAYGPRQGYPNGLRVKGFFWDPNETGAVDVDEMNSDGTTGLEASKQRLIARNGGAGNDNWYGRWWIGELAPDDAYGIDLDTHTPNDWQHEGNLRVGPPVSPPAVPAGEVTVGTGSTFRRANYDDGDWGSGLSQNDRFLGWKGAPSFFNGGSNGTTLFAHQKNCTGSCEDATVQASDAGSGFQHALNSIVPGVMKAAYPFKIDQAVTLDPDYVPPERNLSPYNSSAVRTTLVKPEWYYRNGNSDGTDSAAVVYFSTAASNPSLVSMRGGAVINGFSNTTVPATRTNMISISLMNALHGVLTLGADAQNRLGPIPKVRFTFPDDAEVVNNPNIMAVKWEPRWIRWDDQKYAPIYPDDFTDPGPITYSLSYSNNSGGSWNYINNTTTTTLNWNVSNVTNFPEGQYIFLMQAQRTNAPQYFAYNYRYFSIKR